MHLITHFNPILAFFLVMYSINKMTQHNSLYPMRQMMMLAGNTASHRNKNNASHLNHPNSIKQKISNTKKINKITYNAPLSRVQSAKLRIAGTHPTKHQYKYPFLYGTVRLPAASVLNTKRPRQGTLPQRPNSLAMFHSSQTNSI